MIQVQRKQKGIVRARGDLEEYDDRIHAMSEHLKNVRQELQHTQVQSQQGIFRGGIDSIERFPHFSAKLSLKLILEIGLTLLLKSLCMSYLIIEKSHSEA